MFARGNKKKRSFLSKPKQSFNDQSRVLFSKRTRFTIFAEYYFGQKEYNRNSKKWCKIIEKVVFSQIRLLITAPSLATRYPRDRK